MKAILSTMATCLLAASIVSADDKQDLEKTGRRLVGGVGRKQRPESA